MLLAPRMPSHLYSPQPPSDSDRSHPVSHPVSHPPHPPQPSNNMSCTISPAPAPANRPTTIASRPKLSLQTSCLPRTFGKSSTGLSLSLAAGPTASPTVSNTFKNAYNVAQPCTAPAATSPSRTNKYSKPSSPYPANPYQTPLGVRSILRNSPLEPTCHRRSISGANNGGSTPRRVFFPAKKQVSFRQPLDEEIRTVRYTARHSDLVSESDPKPQDKKSNEDSDSSSDSSLATSDSSGSDEDNASKTGLSKLERKKRKNLSAERQVRAVALLDGLEGDTYGTSTPQTPRQGRVKRRCEWRWTLGPIEKRDELISLPRTPTTPTTTSPPPEFQRQPSSLQNETKLSVPDDSDFTSSPVASQQLSSPGSSVISNPEKPSESQSTIHEAKTCQQ